jgi:uncharacterized protein with PQ loop repeat
VTLPQKPDILSIRSLANGLMIGMFILAPHIFDCNIPRSVYTDVDYTAFFASWISIFFYILAMLPQLWKNYRLKSVDGLSFSFLFIWLLGDTTNMLGAVLTDQYPNIKATSIYFLISDCITLMQYAYYSPKFHNWCSGGRQASLSIGSCSIRAEDECVEVDEKAPLLHSPGKNGRRSYRSLLPTLSLSLMMIAVYSAPIEAISPISAAASSLPLCNFSRKLPPMVVQLGYVMAWISGLLYFFSRIPQIITNYRHKSVQGLSIMLFVLTVAANISYGVAIITRLPEMNEQFFKGTLPYLIGSLGTLLFDLTILGQSFYYKQ